MRRCLYIVVLFIFLPLQEDSYAQVQQLKLNITNGVFSDDTFFLFDGNGKLGVDAFDGLKLQSLGSSYMEIFSRDTTSRNLSINTLPKDLDQILTLPLFIRSTFSDTLTLSISIFENLPSNWSLSIVKPDSADTVAVQVGAQYEFIHSGTFESGVLTVEQFSLIINPGIGTVASNIQGTASKDGWRMLGSSNTNETYSNLLNSFFTQGATGSNSPSANPNVYTWNETSQAFQPVTSFADTIAQGAGFTAFLFEDDDPSDGDIDGGWPKSFSSTGVQGFGTITYPVTYSMGSDTSLNGYNLVSNPYPFTIDWAAASGWTRTNVMDAIWIWDATANSGNGSYKQYISGVGDAINVLAPHQGFWIRTTSTNPVLKSTESVKSSGGTLLKEHVEEVPFIRLQLESEEFNDHLYISFREENEGDRFNVPKLEPLSNEYLMLFAKSTKGEGFSIMDIDLDAKESIRIPLGMATSFEGELEFSISEDNQMPDGWGVVLYDESKDMEYPLNTQSNIIIDTESNYSLILTFDEMIHPDGVPTEVTLAQNFPNPFNPTTNIAFTLPQAGNVRLQVFDLLGREVAKLIDGQRQRGRHNISFDASGLSSGVYIYRLQTAGNVFTRKLTLIK